MHCTVTSLKVQIHMQSNRSKTAYLSIRFDNIIKEAKLNDPRYSKNDRACK
jgi:hypothetical protein